MVEREYQEDNDDGGVVMTDLTMRVTRKVFSWLNLPRPNTLDSARRTLFHEFARDDDEREVRATDDTTLDRLIKLAHQECRREDAGINQAVPRVEEKDKFEDDQLD